MLWYIEVFVNITVVELDFQCMPRFVISD